MNASTKNRNSINGSGKLQPVGAEQGFPWADPVSGATEQRVNRQAVGHARHLTRLFSRILVSKTAQRLRSCLGGGAGDWSRYMHMNIHNIHTISLTSKTNQRG